jgi:hypothetical protein
VLRFICLIWVILAEPLCAGAWPREAGHGFASGSVTLSWPQDLDLWTSARPTQTYTSAYLEYGFSDKITLGLDLGRSQQGTGTTLIFGQYPLSAGSTRAAIQLGVGQIGGEPVVRPGLLFGRVTKNAWISVESFAEISMARRRTAYKFDATWGRHLRRDRKLVVQLQSGWSGQGQPYVKLAPSLIVPTKTQRQLELGAVWGLTGETSMGLKFGIWHEF